MTPSDVLRVDRVMASRAQTQEDRAAWERVKARLTLLEAEKRANDVTRETPVP